jgi:hypothetical protein
MKNNYIFQIRTHEVVKNQRKWHSQDHYNFYSSPNIAGVIKKNEIGKTYSNHREMRELYNILVRKSQRNGSLGVDRTLLKWLSEKMCGLDTTEQG